MNATATLTQFGQMLENLDRWLQAGVAHADQKKFQPDVLAQARLAPDQYELVRQVQAACDQAKFAAAYLTGQTPPSHPDVETTVAELQTRIETCRSYLASLPASAYGGASERRIAPSWLGGKWMHAERYIQEVAIPNFYFHVTTVYAILRHNGVPLGKMDFVGALSVNDA
jgi:hypothetical protein